MEGRTQDHAGGTKIAPGQGSLEEGKGECVGGIRGSEGLGEGGISIYKGSTNVCLQESIGKSETTRITMGPKTATKYLKKQRYEIRGKKYKNKTHM